MSVNVNIALVGSSVTRRAVMNAVMNIPYDFITLDSDTAGQ
jgi:hypothetical protein